MKLIKEVALFLAVLLFWAYLLLICSIAMVDLMNRRGFISLLSGAAGAPLVPWRGLIEPVIVLAGREAPHICEDSFWCNHPSHFKPATPEQIFADIERSMIKMFTPIHVSVDMPSGRFSLGGYYGRPIAVPRSPQFVSEG